MTNWRTEFDEVMLRICNYTQLDDKTPKEYLQGIPLMPREVHLVEVVRHYPGVNTTKLSQITGIPKGSVSKMTRKLAKDNLLELYRKAGNLKEVHYRCTSLGRRVYDAHLKYHHDNSDWFYREFDALETSQKQFLVEILCSYADMMKEFCDKNVAQDLLRKKERKEKKSDDT